MKKVNIHFAKTHLSTLLQEVAAGEIIVIAKAGIPIAKVVPFEALPARREFGLDRTKFLVPEDFDQPVEEFEQLLYGNKNNP